VQSTVLDAFTALGDPNRFRMVELLRAGPRTVNEISERLHLNQPQVSKHLRTLREAGLVDVEPRAQQRHYELRAQSLQELQHWLDRYRQLWEARFDQLDALVEELERGKAKEKKVHVRKHRKK
jgi:DNA-binding transcriptional ArsR family regulator